MKYVNACLFTTFILITVLQIGCLSTGVMGKAEKLVEAQDYQEAIEVYQSIVDSKPGTAAARAAQLAIGELYIVHINQPQRGIEIYKAVIAEAPDSDEAAEAHYCIGMHVYRQKDYDAAQTRFETVVTQFPHLKLRQNAHLMLAKSYEGGQKYEHAVKTFEDFANRYPQSKRAAQAGANKARIQRKFLKDERIESHVEKPKAESIERTASPFGFGPYPEVPVDFPFQEQIWDNPIPEHELLVRIRVKLWKQGTQTTGAMFDNNGLIYPTIPGVIYVEWRTVEEGPLQFVGRRYAAHVMGHPDTAKKWSASYLTELGYERTDVKNDSEASGIKVHEYPDGGIDPYKFLDLPKSLIQNPLHED